MLHSAKPSGQLMAAPNFTYTLPLYNLRTIGWEAARRGYVH